MKMVVVIASGRLYIFANPSTFPAKIMLVAPLSNPAYRRIGILFLLKGDTKRFSEVRSIK